MITYKDKTFCASPFCENKCGRKLTEEIKQEAASSGLPIGAAFFCDLPVTPNQKILKDIKC